MSSSPLTFFLFPPATARTTTIEAIANPATSAVMKPSLFIVPPIPPQIDYPAYGEPGDPVCENLRLKRPFAQAEAVVEPAQRAGRPPVPVSEQPHQRRNEQRAHDRRVDQNREACADSELLDEDDLRRRERADRDAEEERCGGDDPA